MEATYAAIGLLGGMLLSVAFWWVMAHRVVPKLEFSDRLSVLPDPDHGGVRYRVKMRNAGRRDIIDLSIEARMRFPGTNRLRPTTSRRSVATLRVPVSVDHVPRMRRRTTRVIWLYTQDIKQAFLDDALYDGLTARSEASLETVLAEYNGAHIVIQVLAYDAFSGSRKYYESQKYYFDHVKRGYFSGMRVIPEEPSLNDPRLAEALSTAPDE
jgi:hypothetical protein